MYSPVVIEITEAQYLELKIILEKERGREFSMEHVREIADELVDFYLHLAYLRR